MGIDVVAAVLDVVLDDEDRALRPKLALGDRFDHLAQSGIVLGDHGRRGQFTNPGSCGMVVGQVHGDEARQIVLGFELLQAFGKRLGAIEIAVVQVVGTVVRIEMAFEDRDFSPRWFTGLRTVGDELPEAKVGLARLGTLPPQITARRLSDLGGSFGRVSQLASALAVGQRPSLFDEVVGVGCHGPLVAVGTDFAIDIKVVQQHKLVG